MTQTIATPPLREAADSRQAESVLRNALKEQGLRCTSARIAVLREIYSSGSHLDADELYQRLKKKGGIHIPGNRLSYPRPPVPTAACYQNRPRTQTHALRKITRRCQPPACGL